MTDFGWSLQYALLGALACGSLGACIAWGPWRESLTPLGRLAVTAIPAAIGFVIGGIVRSYR